MADRSCSMPGCGNPYRAKGYCSTHYKLVNPDRAYTRICVTCGATWRTTRADGKYCTDTCKAFGYATTTSCAVPDRHPSRSSSVPRSHPSRRPARAVDNLHERTCGWCEASYLTTANDRRFCSRDCKSKAGRARRRDRENDGHVYSWAHVMRVHAALDGCCAYCDEPTSIPEPDHVVPLSRNGSNGNSNILPVCRPCNSDKRDLLLSEWAEDRARRGKQPVRTTLDRHLPAFAHLLPDVIASASPHTYAAAAA